MPLEAGTQLGPYEILSSIGAGGMGEVYKARDTRLGRTVAIKVLPEHVAADPDLRHRFEREAKTISSLNHPHICALYDVGDQDGTSFLVMEYVEGETLADRLRRDGPLALDDAVRYATEIADALEAAHARGIVHRDLKPGNVMLTRAGSKVLDFGIAMHVATAGGEAATRSVATLTAAASVAGTLPYMSPESLRGEPPDARSDVWALGVLLQEMTTGARPFGGDTQAVLTSAILRDPPAPLPDGSPVWLRTVVGRCLSRDPDRRYQRAGEVRAVLEATTAAAAGTAPLPRQRSGRRGLVAAGVAAGVVIATLAGWSVLGDRETGPAGGAVPAAITSLAVLPLDNLSGDPDQEYLSDGMTEMLIAELAKIGSVRVISRVSVMTYKDARKPLPEIAQELGVDAIVTGAIARVGDQVRFTAQLILGATDEHLWTETYQRDLTDMLLLQSQMARTIARQIQAVVSPEAEARLRDTRPVDPEAFELTLRGQFSANQLTQEGLDRAIRYFEEAIEKDADYAPAHAGLAFAYYQQSSIYYPPLEVMPKAKAAARQAIQLDPNLADGHIWLGMAHFVFDWDWPAAERELQIALALNPSSAEARLGYSNYLLSVGRLDEGVREVLNAEELAPGSIVPYASPMGSQWTTFMARQFDLSIEKGREALTIDPTNAWAHVYLGTTLVHQGETDEGLAELLEATRLEDAPLLRVLLTYGYVLSGRPAEARALLTDLQEISRERYICAYEIAVTHAALGNTDEAFRWLYRARNDKADCIPYLNIDPRFDDLRADPRFQALVEEIGFVATR